MSTQPPKRTVLITGCSDGGLGSALALALNHAGWRVLASARNTSKLKDVMAVGIQTVQLDTLSDDSITSAVERVRELTGGSLDALINNAGGGYSAPLMDTDLSQAKALFDLNVWSLITVTRAFLPLLLKSTHPHGALVANNTSIASLIPATVPFQGVYGASKAAASSFTEAMRLELGLLGVRVVNLLTGSVESKFNENISAPRVVGESSIYAPVKEEVEKSMKTFDVAEGMHRGKWAADVAAQLGRKNPPHWIWSGKHATLLRIGYHLPVGFLDGKMKEVSGLGEVERKVQELGGPGVLGGKLL